MPTTRLPRPRGDLDLTERGTQVTGWDVGLLTSCKDVADIGQEGFALRTISPREKR
jgi:hypothetical protein